VEEAGIWNRLHVDLPGALKRAGKLDAETVVVDRVAVRAFGVRVTGPGPVDRPRKGTKHTLMVDRRGTPLSIRTAVATANDRRQILRVVPDFPRVKGMPSRPKESMTCTPTGAKTARRRGLFCGG